MILQNLLRSVVVFSSVLSVVSSPVVFDGAVDLEARGIEDALDIIRPQESAFPTSYGYDVFTLERRSPSSRAKFSKAKAGISSSKTRKTPKSSNQNQNAAPKKQSSKELAKRPPKKPATRPPPDWRKSPSPIGGNAS